MKHNIFPAIFNKLFAMMFFATVFFSNLIVAQADEKLDLLLQKMDTGGQGGLDGSAGGNGGEQEGYKSFVQNELQNIYAQFNKMTEKDKVEQSFQELNKKRIEFATELCQRDERACFLIDEYRSYKSK